MQTTILTPNAPAPIGPYSQAIRSGNLLFCSGQIPLDPLSGEIRNGSIEEETRQVLTNLKAVLGAGGASLSNVVKTTIFLTNMADFPAVNAVYAEIMGDSAPARSTIAVAALPKGARIEIEAVAALA